MAEVPAGQQQNGQQQPQQQQQQDGQQDGQQQPRTYAQEDVDRIVDKVRRNTRREVERAVRRELESRQAPQQQQQQQNQPQGEEDPEPKRDDFDTYEEHQREVARWEARRVAREERAKGEREQQQKEARERQEKAAATWHGKIEQAVRKIADFEDVLEDNEPTLLVIQNAPMREFITESDIGPQIIYELCKNPEEAKRIAALAKYKQAAEIAKLEERLVVAAGKPENEEEDDPNGGGKPEKGDQNAKGDDQQRNADGTFKKAPSKAPDPIEPVGERSANTTTAPSPKDATETWMKKRAAQVAKRAGGGGK